MQCDGIGEVGGGGGHNETSRPKAKVIGTLALLSGLFMVASEVSRASALKGDKVRLTVCPSVCIFVHP